MTRKTLLILAAALAACTAGSDKAADTSTAGARDTAMAAPDTIAAPRAVEWTVNPRGIGPLRAGMTLAEAAAALGDSLVVPAILQECDYARVRNGPDGLLVMLQNGTISRIEVMDSSAITTVAGAKIGDTEERIKSLYPNQVRVEPHAYTDGHYLVVTPASPADSSFRIVFETEEKIVTRFRSGRRPAVEYVEGCS